MRSTLLLTLLLVSPPSPAGEPLVRMDVKDVVPLHELQQHAVVLVSKEDGSVLPLFVDETAAVAIAFRLLGKPTPHPIAQDLLDGLVKGLGGTLTEVRIDGVKDHVYTSHVVIRQAAREVVLEARPSDAVAMALSARVPVFTTRRVMAEAGIRREDIESSGAGLVEPGVGGSGDVGIGAPRLPSGHVPLPPRAQPEPKKSVRL